MLRSGDSGRDGRAPGAALPAGSVAIFCRFLISMEEQSGARRQKSISQFDFFSSTV
jgi:hypothetical protein